MLVQYLRSADPPGTEQLTLSTSLYDGVMFSQETPTSSIPGSFSAPPCVAVCYTCQRPDVPPHF